MCVNNFKRFHKDFTCNVYFNNDSKIIITTIRLNIFVELLTFNISQTLGAICILLIKERVQIYINEKTESNPSYLVKLVRNLAEFLVQLMLCVDFSSLQFSQLTISFCNFTYQMSVICESELCKYELSFSKDKFL